LIKGDQAIFFVYNDNGGIHTEVLGSAPIGIEIQGMMYAYSCSHDSALNNTVFSNYKIINKSGLRVDSLFIGNWSDLDIGSTSDDFIGSDVTRGDYYAFNGDLIDDAAPSGQLTYGANPPAQAVVFLRGPVADANGIDDLVTANGSNYGDGIVDNERLGMSKFMYYNNDASVTGNPASAADYYNYIKGIWKDGTSMTYGGNGHLTGVACNYMFPGSSDPLGYGTSLIPQSPWDQIGSGYLPGDRRGLGSVGPITLQQGSVNELDFAYVYGRATAGGNLASITVMNEHIDSIKQKFTNGIVGCGCAVETGIHTYENANALSIYPNPASENIIIRYVSTSKNVVVKMYDVTGQLVRSTTNIVSGENTVNISALAKGLYLLSVQDGTTTITKRFIKQ
jgi:hypothetical protein